MTVIINGIYCHTVFIVLFILRPPSPSLVTILGLLVCKYLQILQGVDIVFYSDMIAEGCVSYLWQEVT